MAEMMVYHGAAQVVARPVWDGGGGCRDFGPGFYCTDQRELAEEWACAGGQGGFVTEYALNLDALELFDLTAGAIGPFRWLGLLAANRQFRDTAPAGVNGAAWFRERACPDLTPWDAVLGWRADGSRFSMAQAVFSGEAPAERLYRALTQCGTQLVLRTPRALAALRFQSYAAADPLTAFARAKTRDRAVRAAFWPEAPEAGAADRPYDASYLPEAMDHLGEALDLAVHDCGLGADAYLALWCATGQAARFAAGDPAVLCRPGAEQVLDTLHRAGLPLPELPAQIGARDTPEFWCGRTLARYQWETGTDYHELLRRLPASALLEQFAALETLEGPALLAALRYLGARRDDGPALQRLRRAAGLSQRQLSQRAGVSLRMIQQYEQRAKRINCAAGTALRALARVLGCSMEALLEPDGGEAG